MFSSEKEMAGTNIFILELYLNCPTFQSIFVPHINIPIHKVINIPNTKNHFRDLTKDYLLFGVDFCSMQNYVDRAV